MNATFKTILLLTILAGTGCASSPEDETPVRSIEEILTTTTAPEAYGAAERCLRVTDYEQVDVLNDQALIFWGRGDKVWLNRLRTRCIGLRKNSTLRFDLHSTQACDMDTVAAIDNFFLRWQKVSGDCALGKFEPISPQQAEVLLAELQK